MSLDDMTADAVENRLVEASAIEAQIRDLETTTPAVEWGKDLDALDAALGWDRDAKRERDVVTSS